MLVTQSTSASSSQLSASERLSSKPDPLVVVSYSSDSQLYTAAILGISSTAPRLADAITQLHLMLGWWDAGPEYFHQGHMSAIERMRSNSCLKP